ncbi:MAG: TPM domain-containing protein [Candidatus Electronema sp. V4]|uniref:TPM domain-containing protein n=1 Tax=Candidatus Electronema sp. V4 TaxID=3454756 RepID=UPI0040553DDA
MVLRSGLLRAVLRCAALFLLVMVVPAMLRAASPPVPSSPPERVVDLANIIEPALEGQLVASLRELEEKTTAQMVILTVSSLDGETVEAVSLHTFGQWKLGQKGKDNGLLLTVALKERKYRFETGYGLESVLPDSLLGSIGREKLVPFFKEGKYGEGVAAATKEVLAILAKNYSVQLGGGIQIQEKALSASVPVRPDRSQDEMYIVLFIGGMVLLFIIMLFFAKKDGSGSGGYSSDSWSSSDSSSSSSSDDSSSSSDFSGGGGESGGGGSSGSW